MAKRSHDEMLEPLITAVPAELDFPSEFDLFMGERSDLKKEIKDLEQDIIDCGDYHCEEFLDYLRDAVNRARMKLYLNDFDIQLTIKRCLI